MSSPEQLIKLLEFNLSSHNFDNAKKLLNDDDQYGQVILAHYPDVIQQVVLKHLTARNYEEQPQLYEACEYILNMFAEKCHQQGILFEFLEILEGIKDDDDADDVFRSVLKALQVILVKQSESKSRSLEYTLNSIEDYILELPLPELFEKKFMEEEEERLLENDDKVRRILMNYLTLDLFYQPIIQQVVASSARNEGRLFRLTQYSRRNVLFCFILRLLGKPLSYLNLSHDPDSNKVKTYSRDVAANLVTSLCKLCPDIFNILQHIETRCRWPQKDKIDDDLSNIFVHPEKVPLLQMGVLLYLVIVERVKIEMLPRVYRPSYLFSTSIYCINEMIASNDTVAPKGLQLCHQLLSDIHESLSSAELELNIHEDFCNNLMKMLIYSSSKRNRQSALKVMRAYILKFDTAGRFLLIKNIMASSTHKGLIGYLSTLYKDIIFEAIDDDERALSKHLSGFNFKQLLFNSICKLDEGVQCDIAESSDQIIAALNFLIGIIQRDRSNKTGIRDLVPELKSEFLSKLRSALDFSRAHFVAEIERVKSNADTQPLKDGDLMNMEILNDNAPMNEVTREKKLEMLHSALVTFDLIDYHLARVNEIATQICA